MTETVNAGPVFIVGSMRSGSTLLRLILDSHPAIAIGPETGFMGAVIATREIPNLRSGKGWYRRLDWTDDEFDQRLRDFYDGIFGRHAARQGKRRWGDKTPMHTRHIASMSQLFPDSVFLGIVRHPGAVARSLERNFHYTFSEALAYWSVTNLDLVQGGAQLGDRFRMCRYEDLVQASEPLLREVMQFLGEPWSPELLTHHEVQRTKGAPRVTDGSTMTCEPIDASRAERWADHVTPEDSAALERTGGLARLFGYEPLDPAVRPLPDSSAGTYTFGGRDLAAGMARSAGRLERAVPAPLLYGEASREELAARLAHVEAALRRVRSRRAVRVADALRRLQRGRSKSDLKSAWRAVQPLRSRP